MVLVNGYSYARSLAWVSPSRVVARLWRRIPTHDPFRYSIFFSSVPVSSPFELLDTHPNIGQHNTGVGITLLQATL